LAIFSICFPLPPLKIRRNLLGMFSNPVVSPKLGRLELLVGEGDAGGVLSGLAPRSFGCRMV
jgi:hypothetical protein